MSEKHPGGAAELLRTTLGSEKFEHHEFVRCGWSFFCSMDSLITRFLVSLLFHTTSLGGWFSGSLLISCLCN